MQETHFVNACGLDVDGHETSAYDIALMSRELMTKFGRCRNIRPHGRIPSYINAQGESPTWLNEYE